MNKKENPSLPHTNQGDGETLIDVDSPDDMLFEGKFDLEQKKAADNEKNQRVNALK